MIADERKGALAHRQGRWQNLQVFIDAARGPPLGIFYKQSPSDPAIVLFSVI
jgi:hypothetical protein